MIWTKITTPTPLIWDTGPEAQYDLTGKFDGSRGFDLAVFDFLIIYLDQQWNKKSISSGGWTITLS